MKKTTWKDNNNLSKLRETVNSTNEAIEKINDTLSQISSYNFSPNIRKPVISVRKIEGVYSDNYGDFLKGSYYRSTDGMVVTGIALFNIPEGMENNDKYSWDISAGLSGHGIGLYLRATQTLYSKIVPIPNDRTTLSDIAEYFENNCSDRYIDCFRNWDEVLLNSFTPDDWKELFEEFKEEEAEVAPLDNDKLSDMDKVAEEINSKIDRHSIGTPKGVKDFAKVNWIEKNYPCASREGFAFRGAKAKPITKKKALEGIYKCTEIRVEDVGGVKTLVLQDYSANDLY